VWQWALHWLVAGALYLAVGLASGVWVAPTKWLFWTTYFWAAFVVLPQSIQASLWAYFWVYPTPLQGDYTEGYFVNTRGMRAYLDNIDRKSGEGVLRLVAIWGILFLAQRVLHFAAGALSVPQMVVVADWLLRLHPWRAGVSVVCAGMGNFARRRLWACRAERRTQRTARVPTVA
jgi:hypothetical protein